MLHRTLVTNKDEMRSAIKNRARHIDLQTPQGMSEDEFLANLVVFLKELPEMKGFDSYEIEAIIRNMAK